MAYKNRVAPIMGKASTKLVVANKIVYELSATGTGIQYKSGLIPEKHRKSNAVPKHIDALSSFPVW